MISKYFTETDSAFAVSNDEKCAVIFRFMPMVGSLSGAVLLCAFPEWSDLFALP
jgi:hypothetical protein